MNKDEKAILESYGTIVEGTDGWHLSNNHGGAVNSAYWSKLLVDADPPIHGMLRNVDTVLWREVGKIDVNR